VVRRAGRAWRNPRLSASLSLTDAGFLFQKKEVRTLVGMVRIWNEARGFGFIRLGHGVEDLFFHRGDVRSPIRTGDEVSFWIGDSTNPSKPGRIAVEVAVRAK
jgi:cold shock CspA family protein